MVKMIATDIDGTIARKQKIHPTTIRAIKYANELNIPVVIATGRSVKKIKPIAKQLGITSLGYHFIGVNGGLIFRFLNEEEIVIDFKKVFTKNQASTVFKEAKKLKIKIFAYSEDEEVGYCSQKFGFFNFSAKIWSKKKRLVHSTKLDDSLPIIKFLCFGNEKRIEKFKNILTNEKFSIFDFSYKTKARSNVEISPPGVNKSNGLQFVCDELGISPKEIIYFGDGHNDLEAIKFAGIGVAMKNASEEIRDAADKVTDFNAEDGGVGEFLFAKIFKEID